MNEMEMKALLDRLDEKTTTVCGLNESMRMYYQRWDNLHSLILGLGTPCSESIEDFIKRMVFEHKRLKITERDHADLLSALDEVPLPQEDQESYPAYALRAGDAMRALKDDKSTLQQDLHEARLEHSNDQSIISGLQQHVSNRDARIAKLEKRESELNALHDTIEALRGFPMQPEEKYSEYLQRLAENRFQLAADLEHLKQSTVETTQRLRAQLDDNNAQYQILSDKLANMAARNAALADSFTAESQARLVAERDKAREEATTAIAEREHFRAKWDASLKARDSAQDEARRTRETNEALQGQLTLHSQIIARVMMDPATDKLFNERDWSDAARKVLIDARGMAIDDGKVQA